MNIIQAIWFTEMGSMRPIGIVLGVDNITGERKAFIGTASGDDEGADAERIAAGGAKLRVGTVNSIAQWLNDDE